MANRNQTSAPRDQWNLEPYRMYKGSFSTDEDGNITCIPTQEGSRPECKPFFFLEKNNAYEIMDSTNWFTFKIKKRELNFKVFEDFIEEIYKILKNYYLNVQF